MTKRRPPIGVKIKGNVEFEPHRPAAPYRARVRWKDPKTGKRTGTSESYPTEEEATAWIEKMKWTAAGGVDPATVEMKLADYGNANLSLALRGLEAKTTDPYIAGWKLRVVPTLGHISLGMLTYGAVDRAVHAWIADGCSKSTIKNSLAVLVRVAEQAVRDGIIDRNPTRITGWQREFTHAEDELEDPRSLALPDWISLTTLADALVAKSANNYQGWGDVVMFAACTAARIGEVSGCRVKDIDTETWMWTVRRQTTPGPGGLIDKGTKGRRARKVPIIEELRDLVQRRIALAGGAAAPDARLFFGPRGGRITTAVLRDATSWDDVVTAIGFEHLRRHDLRHTGLTWLADAGVKVHDLRKIAGHGSITTTQRYLHPDDSSISNAGELLSKHLSVTGTGKLRAV